jgi:transposase InsO family protein
VNEVYTVVAHLDADNYAVSVLCETLGVSRSAYYDWLQGEFTLRQREDSHLKPFIQSIFWEHRRRYGARRIAMELAARELPCSRRRVGRLMKEMELMAIQPRTFKPRTTDSRHSLGYNDNLLLNAPQPTANNQLWVGDITYIPIVGAEFLYLAMLMDRYSRRIVGWSLQDHMQESLVLETLQSAIALRQPAPGLMHHTDRGGQYAGSCYRQTLGRARMIQSMSRAADCYDNAFMESCFGTLKTELEMTTYQNRDIAHKEVPEYIRYYNTRRRHSSIGYLSPEAFEELRR